MRRPASRKLKIFLKVRQYRVEEALYHSLAKPRDAHRAAWGVRSATFTATCSEQAVTPCALAIHSGFARNNLPE